VYLGFGRYPQSAILERRTAKGQMMKQDRKSRRTVIPYAGRVEGCQEKVWLRILLTRGERKGKGAPLRRSSAIEGQEEGKKQGRGVKRARRKENQLHPFDHASGRKGGKGQKKTRSIGMRRKGDLKEVRPLREPEYDSCSGEMKRLGSSYSGPLGRLSTRK